MQWKPSMWTLSGTEITGFTADNTELANHRMNVVAGLNVINVKTTGAISEKTGTPVYGVTVTFPQGWVENADLNAIVNLVSAGRLTIILERNGALSQNWFEVIGGDSGLLANFAGDSGKKPEDFDVTEITLVGSSGKSMIQLIKSTEGRYEDDLLIVQGLS